MTGACSLISGTCVSSLRPCICLSIHRCSGHRQRADYRIEKAAEVERYRPRDVLLLLLCDISQLIIELCFTCVHCRITVSGLRAGGECICHSLVLDDLTANSLGARLSDRI